MTRAVTAMAAALLLIALATAAPAWAFDPELTFHKGAFVLSGEGAYGWSLNLESRKKSSSVEFFDVGVRFSLLPFDTFAKDSWLYGALELGLEPLWQQYTEPKHRMWAGLAAVARYHFLRLGRVVPYVELAGSAGATDLRLREIRSDFAFLVFGGAGLSVFVNDRTAVYGGYRWEHVSNGNTSEPNRGFESNVVVLGVSLFF